MIDPELVESIRARRTILFIGAGVSRVIDLPSFDELIEELASDLGYDPDVFSQLGDLETLAEFYRLEKGGFGDLLDTRWHSEKGIQIQESKVHKLITLLEAPIIYTTNWDRWIEEAHRHWNVQYQRVATIADIRDLEQGKTQIVKFHGDFSADESLVLAESSYLRRLDFSDPLDIKLRADTLGRTILFLGYSLRDTNARLLLFKLHQLWKESPHAEGRPRSFLVMDRPNAVQERVLKDWGVTYLVADGGESPTERLETFLRNLWVAAFNRDPLDN